MTNLKHLQLRWSAVALVVASVIGVLVYEQLAKKMIILIESDRLVSLSSKLETSDTEGIEVRHVMIDGTLAPGEMPWSEPISREALLKRVFASQRTGYFEEGWVYYSMPDKTGRGGLANGWVVARTSTSGRLKVAAFIVMFGSIGVWFGLMAVFRGFFRKFAEGLGKQLELHRSELGLPAHSERGNGDPFKALQDFCEDSKARHDKLSEELQEAAWFSAFCKESGNGLFICDGEGRLVWTNDRFVALTGLAEGETNETSPLSFVCPEANDPVVLAKMFGALAGGKSFAEDLGARGPQGRPFWAALEFRPVPESLAGGETKFFGCVVDISRHRLAEEELEEVSKRFSLAVDSDGLGIWEWDVKRDVLVWDERTFSLYGRSRLDFEPSFRSWMKCVHADDRNRVTRRIEVCLASGQNIELVVCVEQADGSERFVKNVARAFRNEVGEVLRYIGVASDVTEEHIAKRNLIEQKEEAETLAIRLAEAVKESKAAAEAARQATKAKSSFLAMMSHEIRTPMNGVIGMASLLLETELDEHQKDYLNTIRVSGDTLLTLINDILDYSKIESGKLDIEKASFSVRDCVEEAADLLASKAAEKGIDLICRIACETPATVTGDITRLRQILVNLIGNAVKFTEVGEVEVMVHAPADRKIHFSVRDTGIGIPEDRMNRLFEVFSQVDSSTTRKYGGSGLGLSISKQLTALMGGKMWVESSVGKGSVFHFTIEFQDLDTSNTDPLLGKQVELSDKNILIVEPNGRLRSNLTELATAWGMNVDELPTAEHVASLAGEEKSYDFVLLDASDPAVSDDSCIRVVDALCKDADLILTLQNHGSKCERNGRKLSIFKPLRLSSLLDAFKGATRQSALQNVSSPSGGGEADSALAGRLPLRILVADDNSVNQKVARMMLKKFGYGADLVANGVEAVEAVKRKDYDLIFMDCQMPEMDGFEATKMIRSIERDSSSNKRSIIYALTANVREESLEMSKESGMDGFLAKPIKLGDIKTALGEVEREYASRN